PPYRPGNNVALFLSGEDDSELRTSFQRLSEGGTVTLPLERQVWGDVAGSVVDRFGITWMVDISDGATDRQPLWTSGPQTAGEGWEDPDARSEGDREAEGQVVAHQVGPEVEHHAKVPATGGRE